MMPREMLTISIRTQKIWGMNDTALRPELLDVLEADIADWQIHKIEAATHWVTHERPMLGKLLIGEFMA